MAERRWRTAVPLHFVAWVDHDGPVTDEHESSTGLGSLRRRIDALDRKLVELLNERAQIAVEIGKHKRIRNGPVYAPHREIEVLRRVLEANVGPLPAHTLESIFREIMSGSFALEQPPRIGYVGPPGSESHAAAVAQFGSSVAYENLREVSGVFTEVRRGHVDYGLVPVESSIHGAVAETFDGFWESMDEVSVYAEIITAVHHNLLANCEPSEVRRIHARPEVLGQCRQWLATQYPHADLVAAASGSEAAIRARQELEAEPGCGAAAIGTVLAGKLHGLNVLFQDIEDSVEDLTRLLIIARQRAEPSGNDKTSLMFTALNAPGALVGVLQCFAERDINLTHIDKRPSRRDERNHTFLIDADGHVTDPALASAIEDARAKARELVVLGSYPRALRII